jgi:hypothetical protein
MAGVLSIQCPFCDGKIIPLWDEAHDDPNGLWLCETCAVRSKKVVACDAVVPRLTIVE